MRASDRVLFLLALALSAMAWRLADGTGAAASWSTARSVSPTENSAWTGLPA